MISSIMANERWWRQWSRDEGLKEGEVEEDEERKQISEKDGKIGKERVFLKIILKNVTFSFHTYSIDPTEYSLDVET